MRKRGEKEQRGSGKKIEREKKMENKNREKRRKYVKGPLEVRADFERQRYFVKSTDRATI